MSFAFPHMMLLLGGPGIILIVSGTGLNKNLRTVYSDGSKINANNAAMAGRIAFSSVDNVINGAMMILAESRESDFKNGRMGGT
jgi:hypothetical protein